MNLGADLLAVDIEDLPILGRQDAHLVVAQVNDALRIADQGARIAGQKDFLVADAQDQRTAEAGADDHAWKARADDRQAVGALEMEQRLLHRLDQVVLQIGGDQVGDDLGIGLAAEEEAVALGAAV